MRKRKISKRAENEGGNTVVGLVLLALVLVTVIYITSKYGGMIISIISKKVLDGVAGVFSNPSSITSASEANFERLNDELDILLKSTKTIDHRIVPYSLGQRRLIGFNRDDYDSINKECIGEDYIKLLPDKCKKASCLCLCYRTEKCECEVYSEVDYFITTENQDWNEGKTIPSIKNPLDDKDVKCLMIKPNVNMKGEFTFANSNNWWGSNMVYLEKIDDEGKRYILFSRIQEIGEYIETEWSVQPECDTMQGYENCSLVLSCPDYKTVNLGCDWQTACDKNICDDSGLTTCALIDNEASRKEGDNSFCFNESDEQSLCIRGITGKINCPGESNILSWDKDSTQCFRCVGMNHIGEEAGEGYRVNSEGWIIEPELTEETCINT